MSRHAHERSPLDTHPTSSISTSHSPPRSPHSTASLPSPPSSPNHRDRDQNSMPGSPSSLASDFPLSSLNSSLFLSEESSPVLNPDLSEDASRTLIMPSLMLPSPSRHDAVAGETIGNVKLWIMGRRSHACRSAAEGILEGPSLVVDVDPWKNTPDNYPILRASTILSSPEVRSRRNIEILLVEIDERDSHTDLTTILDVIHRPFSAVDRLLNTSEPSSTSFIPLLTSNSTLLYTALIFLWPSTPNEIDVSLVRDLAPHIPIIPIHASTPIPHLSHRRNVAPHPASAITNSPFSSLAISTIRPSSLSQLRDLLFHSPSVLTHLRTEAAERFLRWRDLNAALRQLSSSTSSLAASISRHSAIHRRPRSSTTRAALPPSFSSTTMMNDHEDQQHPDSDEHLLPNPWMWNWESRFSRDVRDAANTLRTDDPAGTYEEDGEAGMTLEKASSSRTVGSSSLRRSNSQRLGNGVPGGRSLYLPPHGHSDPLHLRSIAVSVMSVVPMLGLRLFGFRRSRSNGHRRSTATAPAPESGPSSSGGRGPTKHFPWGLFGLGVSVGVAISLCVVGLGLNFYKR
ncbi:uncharacterized protein EI90DRAFT_3044013 [Cantharellus anzutake]|uniref:uncharacterized protein n=1 Tax=Cantharellus anzutake TaxID=1750568 RepID=UPI001903D3DA|nr:uncharacterized protein EI90DRAFT_3044013 [Cantharellus anzutake]KAF8336889.1 hypothetical protein EI90DRAFT_3044013 [Cantharellus anzutake]